MTWKKGQSGNPSGRKRSVDARARELIRADEFTNATTGFGISGRDKRIGGEFAVTPVPDMEAAQYWRGNDIAQKVIECIPNEALRQGYEIRVGDDDDQEEKKEEKPEIEEKQDGLARLRRLDAEKREQKRAELSDADAKEVQERVEVRHEELGVCDAIQRALYFRNAYGGGAIFLGANDGRALFMPLNVEKVSDFTHLSVHEPQELEVEAYYEDLRSPKFGEPKLWRFQPEVRTRSGSGTQQLLIHESRLVTFTGRRVSNRSQGELREGWGDSELTSVLPVLRDFSLTWNAAAVLMTDFAQAVIKIVDLHKMFASNRAGALMARLAMIDAARSTVRAVLIDKEEEFERKQTPLSGLPELLREFATRLSAATQLPVTMLMGMSPGGLNATGDSDIRIFYDRVAAFQSKFLVKPIERITTLIMRAEGIKEPARWSVNFRPLWQVSELERTQARNLQAQSDKIYIESAVLSPEEVAISRFKGDQYSFETMVDFSLRAELEPAADPPAKTEQKIAEEEAQAEERAASLELTRAKSGATAAKGQPPGAAKAEDPAA